MAMVVDARRTRYVGAFGARNVAAGVAMTPDTIFRLASMTKPLTSTLIMMLAGEGRLSVDDPVSAYLPEFRAKQVFAQFDAVTGHYTSRPAVREVTVHHLLNHTSGLGYNFASPVLGRLLAGEAPTASGQALPLLHDPGERWTYGESTRVLGAIMEKITGQPLETLMRERLFVPLGMHETWYTVPAAHNARVVTVHRRKGGHLVEEQNPPGEIVAPQLGDGGLNSTAADYAKFVQLFLNDGCAPDGTRILSQRALRAMCRGEVRVELQAKPNREISEPFPLGAGRDTYGLGFQVTGEPREPGMRLPGALSWGGLFNTEFWIDRAAGLGAILLMQYLPFYDTAAVATLQGFEQRVYSSLPPD